MQATVESPPPAKAKKNKMDRGLVWRPDRGSWYLRMWKNGKEYWRDLDTDIKATARERAKVKRRQIEQDAWDLAAGIVKPERLKVPTVGQVIDLYSRVMRGPRPAPYTVRKNVDALLLVVRDALGLQDKEDARDVSVTKLNQELAWAFQQARINSMSEDPDAQGSVSVTIRSMLIKARAIFTENAMMHYRRAGWTFAVKLHCSHKSLPAVDRRYVPLPAESVAGIERDALLLKNGVHRQQQMYKGYLLESGCALRAGEVIAAKWSWIEKTPDGACIAIIKRPDYNPKGTEGRVPIDLATLRELEALRTPGSEYIIEAETPTERDDIIRRDLSLWLRRYMPDRTNTNHTLRKHCISVVLTKSKSWPDAQKFARHASSSTTEAVYGALLDQLQPVSRADWQQSA